MRCEDRMRLTGMQHPASRPHGRSGRLLPLLLAALLCVTMARLATAADATVPLVQSCGPQALWSQSRLQAAIEKAIPEGKRIQALSDGTPCQHAREVTASLRMRAGRNELAAARLHTSAVMRLDGQFLSIEEYLFADDAAATRALRWLDAQGSAPPRSKAVVSRAFRQAGPRVLVLLVDAHARNAVMPAFEAVAEQVRLLSAEAPR